MTTDHATQHITPGEAFESPSDSCNDAWIGHEFISIPQISLAAADGTTEPAAIALRLTVLEDDPATDHRDRPSRGCYDAWSFSGESEPMTIQLSRNSFLQMLSQSHLLTDEQLRNLQSQLAHRIGVTARTICDMLIADHVITEWQAEKLLQAKFRGFFLGPYRLLHRVARGGMSTIYSARHIETGEVHALKVLPLTRLNNPSYLARFQREAAVTQRLQHPNIVRVFGVYSVTDGKDPVHFMAMELLEGQDLAEIVQSEGPLPARQAAELIRQAAKGLDHAHSAGLVHRDVKPANMFLTTQQTLRILDLGLAQDFDSEENLTREFNERVIGTADYLAPEQAADSHTVDGRADIYGLGCSLYFLLSGQPPFTEGTLVQRLVAHRTKEPRPMSSFRSDVPAGLITILHDMMMKDPDLRISSAAEVVRRLNDFLKELAGQLTDSDSIDPNSDLPVISDAEIDALLPAEDVGSVVEEPPAEHLQLAVDAFMEAARAQPFLRSFTSLLTQIEEQCREHGPLSADPRCADLRAIARRLNQVTFNAVMDEDTDWNSDLLPSSQLDPQPAHVESVDSSQGLPLSLEPSLATTKDSSGISVLLPTDTDRTDRPPAGRAPVQTAATKKSVRSTLLRWAIVVIILLAAVAAAAFVLRNQFPNLFPSL
jgi:serine/threonine protein kinase